MTVSSSSTSGCFLFPIPLQLVNTSILFSFFHCCAIFSPDHLSPVRDRQAGSTCVLSFFTSCSRYIFIRIYTVIICQAQRNSIHPLYSQDCRDTQVQLSSLLLRTTQGTAEGHSPQPATEAPFSSFLHIQLAHRQQTVRRWAAPSSPPVPVNPNTHHGPIRLHEVHRCDR